MSIATSGNFFTQLFYYMCIHNSFSIVWFIISAIPSIWRCKAILNVSVISNKDINSSQKWLQKWESRSLVIYSGSPCWLTAVLRNLSEMMSASNSCNGTSCTILLNLLMHVITIVCSSFSGSLDMKSMWIYYNGWLVTGSGAYSPATIWVSDLKCWHVSQFLQYFHILWVILSQ